PAPRPAVVLDARARLCAWNPAMHAWLRAGPAPELLLPKTLAHLVQAVLEQQRAIEDVRVAVPDGRQLLWSFFALTDGHVQGRARDATETLSTFQQAQQARR